MTGLAERTLPSNLEAERAVLGTVLVTHGRVLDTVADQLRPEEFYREAHRRIFRTMVTLFRRGEAIDFVTLREALTTTGDLEEVGGPAYITALADGVPVSTNVAYYARIVREKATGRDVIAVANRLLTAAYDLEDPVALIDQAERALLAVSHQAVPGDLVSAAQMSREIYPVLEALTAARQPVTGVSTGLADLDHYTRGLQPGSLVILAGRPSTGKSSLALQWALHVAQTQPVAFFSVEMSQQEQVFRVLATLAHVDGHHLQCGQLSTGDQTQVGLALTAFSQRYFWLDDSGAVSPLQVRSRARRLKAQHGLGLILVDYLQLVQHGRAESREQAVAATARLLKQVARELDVPLVALCQLSRKVEERADKRPQLSDLRESGALEQDADLVLLIHRPPPKNDGVVVISPSAELIIAKQRNGPTASVELVWRGEQYRFAELAARR